MKSEIILPGSRLFGNPQLFRAGSEAPIKITVVTAEDLLLDFENLHLSHGSEMPASFPRPLEAGHDDADVVDVVCTIGFLELHR
jgi:hypothetical protein